MKCFWLGIYQLYMPGLCDLQLQSMMPPCSKLHCFIPYRPGMCRMLSLAGNDQNLSKVSAKKLQGNQEKFLFCVNETHFYWMRMWTCFPMSLGTPEKCIFLFLVVLIIIYTFDCYYFLHFQATIKMKSVWHDLSWGFTSQNVISIRVYRFVYLFIPNVVILVRIVTAE